jgi:carboxyl-terminal processing protease
MSRSWRRVGLVIFLLAVLAGGLVGERLLAFTDEARATLRMFTELVSLAHDRYGEEIAYRDLVEASIQGMLQVLDPHTSFLSASAYSAMRDRQESTFSGLGILVGMRNGRLTVITPIEGTPASRLGLRAGDHINTIEGEPTETMGLDAAVRRLKGPKGTQVTITVVRAGLEEPLEFTITRDVIPQTTVRYAYMIEPGTGYIYVTDFNRGTGREVAEALARLREEGMERLLFDLRNNGGGLLDQAIAVSDQFLGDGAKIVETRGRTRDSFQEYRATDRYAELDLPMIVLVSEGSASASEIVSGAIQDHDIGLIVGTPTWGKGLVQTVYSLPYGAGLALTTAQYYTPSGRLIQRDYTSWFDYGNHNGDLADGLDPGEAFQTDLGRTVYGGGGIAPDVLVEPDQAGAFVQFLAARNAFFDYAVEYTSRNTVAGRDWQPSEEVIEGFLDWIEAQGLAEREEIEEGLSDPQDRERAMRLFYAEVVNSVFGLEARYEVLAGGDNQIRKALTLFDQAGELLARRKALAAPDERQVAQVQPGE